MLYCMLGKMRCRPSESPTATRRPSHGFAISSGSLRSPIRHFTDRMWRPWRRWILCSWLARICSPNGRSRCCGAKIWIPAPDGIHRIPTGNRSEAAHQRSSIVQKLEVCDLRDVADRMTNAARADKPEGGCHETDDPRQKHPGCEDSFQRTL